MIPIEISKNDDGTWNLDADLCGFGMNRLAESESYDLVDHLRGAIEREVPPEFQSGENDNATSSGPEF